MGPLDPERICPTCEVIVSWALAPRELGEKETLPWHPNPRSWFRTITSCPFCKLVGRFVFQGYFTVPRLSERSFFAEMESVPGATRVTWMVFGDFGGKEEELSVLAVEDEVDATFMDFWLVTPDSPLGRRPIWQKPLPHFKDRITVIKDWLDNCCNPGTDHQHCRPPSTSSLPTRLLYVRQNGRRKDVRLVLTDSLQNNVTYTTLSHCWGPPTVEPPLKTTRPLLRKFLKHVSFSDLPKNYRHAITLTRKLGIDYIWIDSLCIIQGDAEDWEIESARMATYYRGSYLTIGAAASTNCHGGFIGDLDAPEYSTWAAGRHSRGTILMRKQTTSAHGLSGNDGTEKNALLKRGWVLQEQVLSPRTVFCTGSGQLLWQCHSLFTSEDGTVNTHRFSSLQRSANCAFDMTDKKVAHLSWWQWISDYSKRQLTYGTDRAPAIAGLVDFYQSETGHTPLLGLWKETIGYDLTWFISGASSASRETQFPSWSWLGHLDATDATSILSHVNIAHEGTWGTLMTEMRVVSCDVDWRSQPFTSELQGAALEVEGLAKDADLASPDDGTHQAWTKLRDRSWEDTDAQMVCTLDRLPDQTVPEERPNQVRAAVWLHLCRITHDYEPRQGQSEETHINDYILVLERMSQDERRYRRLGLINRGSVKPREATEKSFPEDFFGLEDRRRFEIV
ncbi:heterokaryon incompatibility protein-domain-containing protein [Podospora conica]|nr:heterokaryon incompatibility protein-domain-containing protein [Schizothecium conicum]